MQLIILFGPPAVGKMTVGDEIARLTGIPVFHNHLSIEPVLRFFPFGSPPFNRLVDGFRREVVREVAASDLPGMTFTFAWGLDYPEDAAFLEDICGVFEAVGANVALVELKADLNVRLERNRGASRLAEKPSKRDVALSEKRLIEGERMRMNSDGSVPLPYPHIVIDNTVRDAADVAAEIVDQLHIPRRES